MNDQHCPNCDAPLTPFNLLENDARLQIVYTKAVLEPSLSQYGLRCTKNEWHTFGFRHGALVEIDCVYSQTNHVPHPNPTLRERVAGWAAEFIFHRLNWLPLPHRTWEFLLDQRLYPWQVAESWYTLYDPNGDQLSPEEETGILADAAADQLGEDGDWRGPEDDFAYGDDDYDSEEEAAAWADHSADEIDRDRFYTPTEDDSDQYPWSDQGRWTEEGEFADTDEDSKPEFEKQ